MLAFFGWFFLMNRLYPQKPVPPPSAQTNAVASAAQGTNQTSAVPTTVSASSPGTVPNVPVPVANTNVAEEFQVVTNEKARYTFTTHGGGLKLVELLEYPETVSTKRTKQTQTNRVATLNQCAPAPTLALLGGSAIQGDGIFTLTKTEKGVRAEKTLTNGLTIIKEFTPSTNYLVMASVRLENHSTQALVLPSQEWVLGTATPMGPLDDGTAVGIIWYNGAKTAEAGAGYFSSQGFMCTPKIPPAEYRAGASNVVWAAAHNQFFALAVMPKDRAEAVVARRLELPRPTGEEAKYVSTNGPPPQGYAGSLIYPAQTISANQTLAIQHGYICTGGGTLVLLLPPVSVLGDIIEITIDGSAGFQVTQGAGQSIKFGNQATTAGVGGSISTTGQGDTIRMVCQTANLKWNILASMGNLTFV